MSDYYDHLREHSIVKHTILVKYLNAYLHILKKFHRNLNYFDCFAGIGEMPDGTPVSPMRVLKLIAENPQFSKGVNTFFCEPVAKRFDQLEKCVMDFYDKNYHIRKPRCYRTTFVNWVEEINNCIGKTGKQFAPSFFFVDPTDITGIPMKAIKCILTIPKTEVFVFLNYAGVSRTLGLEAVPQAAVELFGDENCVIELQDQLKENADNPKLKEMLIRDAYFSALRDLGGAKYIVPFRVEMQEKMSTSHYLVHGSNHPLGFKIMKEIMWLEGKTSDQHGVRLELLQESKGQTTLFDIDFLNFKRDLLKRYAGQVRAVKDVWDETDPNDLFLERTYKQALVELEKEGKIQVFEDRDCKIPAPADKRRPYKGNPTLGNTKWLHFLLDK